VVEVDTDLAAPGEAAAAAAEFVPPAATPRGGAVEIRGLTKRFGDDTVVDAIAVSIAPGSSS